MGVEKGKGLSPREVQLFAILVWTPVPAMIEAALFGLVQAMNYPFES